jgi:diguanylate cyclase
LPDRVHKQPTAKPEFGVSVMRRMTQLGVAVIPQNFEVFYAAMCGSHPDLARELSMLGNAPLQSEIDRVANRYFAERLQYRVAGITQNRLNEILDTITALIETEAVDLTKYSDVMSKASLEFEAASKKPGGQNVSGLLPMIRVLLDSTSDRSDGTQILSNKITHQANELEKTRKELETFRSLANTDHVTQLLNRRCFDEELQKIYARGHAEPAGLMLLDIDHFKRFNDLHGHPLGDVILKRVAETIKGNIRSDIITARVGGEEFAVIAKGIDAGIFELIAERIRTAVANLENIDRKTGKDFGQITVSIGICMAEDADNAQTLYRKADEMMYRSKQTGRNRTTVYSRQIPRPEIDDLHYDGRYFRQP